MPNETLSICFKYFRIHYAENCTQKLPGILDALIGNPPSEKTAEIHREERLLKIKSIASNGNRAWLFASKRMRGLPMKIKGDGSSESLMLAEEEGLGENAALACDPTGSVAAIQSGKHAMSEKIIAKFINTFRPDASINFLPILKIDALDRLARAEHVRKIRIKLGAVVDFTTLEPLGLSVNDAMSLQHLYQSPTMEIVWSMGRQRKENLPAQFLNMLKALVRFKNSENYGGQFGALDAVLRMEENGAMVSSPVDFLTDRLYYTADVALNQQREIDEGELLSVACSALTENAHDLQRYLPNS